MKKLQFKVLFAVVISAMISQNASAQLLAANAKTATSDAVFIASGNTSAFKTSASLNKAGLKAMKGFNEKYKNPEGTQWYVEGKSINANFPSQGGRTYVTFDKSGHLMNSMAIYSEAQMPKDIRSIVKQSIYYDFTIKTVQEVDCEIGKYYVVHLEDATDYKQVIIYEGELKLLKEFRK